MNRFEKLNEQGEVTFFFMIDDTETYFEDHGAFGKNTFFYIFICWQEHLQSRIVFNKFLKKNILYYKIL